MEKKNTIPELISAAAEAELVLVVFQGIMIDLAEKQRVFPAPQCSEQSRVFVFPGRAPSSSSGIVHVLHGGLLLIRECDATSWSVYCF